MPDTPPFARHLPLSATDYHVLLVLAERDLYGYGILKAVEEESGGAVAPETGSLYRVLARLIDTGMVAETDAPESAPEASPGRPRKYYRITGRGRKVLEAESLRLRRALELARERDLLPEAGSP